jgi:mono/diheme cytochrome c family protein
MATTVFVLFWVLLGVAVLMAAMGSNRRNPLLDSNTRGGRRAAAAVAVVAVAVFAIAIPIAVGVSGNDAAEAGPVQLSEAEQDGRQAFVRNCAQCHQLDAANAVGRVGPDLDVLQPPKELVLDAIEEGRARGQGQMPADLVEGATAAHVAEFVAKTAGR